MEPADVVRFSAIPPSDHTSGVSHSSGTFGFLSLLASTWFLRLVFLGHQRAAQAVFQGQRSMQTDLRSSSPETKVGTASSLSRLIHSSIFNMFIPESWGSAGVLTRLSNSPLHAFLCLGNPGDTWRTYNLHI